MQIMRRQRDHCPAYSEDLIVRLPVLFPSDWLLFRKRGYIFRTREWNKFTTKYWGACKSGHFELVFRSSSLSSTLTSRRRSDVAVFREGRRRALVHGVVSKLSEICSESLENNSESHKVFNNASWSVASACQPVCLTSPVRRRLRSSP